MRNVHKVTGQRYVPSEFDQARFVQWSAFHNWTTPIYSIMTIYSQHSPANATPDRPKTDTHQGIAMLTDLATSSNQLQTRHNLGTAPDARGNTTTRAKRLAGMQEVLLLALAMRNSKQVIYSVDEADVPINYVHQHQNCNRVSASE